MARSTRITSALLLAWLLASPALAMNQVIIGTVHPNGGNDGTGNPAWGPPSLDRFEVTENGGSVPWASSGTFGKLYVTIGSAPGGSGITYTLRINGADTAVLCTIGAAQTTCSYTASTVSITAGQKVTIRRDGTHGSGVNTVNTFMALTYVATTANESAYGTGPVNSGVVNLDGTSTYYSRVLDGKAYDWSTSTTNQSSIVAAAGNFAHIEALLLVATGAAKSRKFELYKNGVLSDGTNGTTDTSCTITNGTTCSASFTLAVESGDTIACAEVPTSTPANSTAFCSVAFQPTTAGQYMISDMPGTPSVSAVNYGFQDYANYNATESNVYAFASGDAMTFSGLRIRLAGTSAPGTNAVAVMKNGSATSLTCTTTFDYCVDPVNSAAFTASTDTFSIRVTPANTPTSRVMMWAAIVGTVSPAAGGGTKATYVYQTACLYSTVSANIYGALDFCDTAQTTEPGFESVWPIAGNVQNLSAVLGGSPGTGSTVVYSVRVNEAETSVTCSIVAPATSCTDTTNKVAVNAGDRLSMHFNRSVTGTPASVGINIAFEFDSTTLGQSANLSSALVPSTSATSYAPIIGYSTNFASPSTTAQVIIPVATAGNVKALYISQSAAPGASKTFTYTIYKNGTKQDGTGGTVNTQVAITGAGTCPVSTNCYGSTAFTLPVVAGDTLYFETVPASTPAATKTAFAIAFTATATGQFNFCGSQNGNDSATATRYVGVHNLSAPNGTEANRTQVFGPNSYTFGKMQLRAAAAPGGSLTRTLNFRVNSGGTTPTVTLTGAATTGSDTTNTVTVTSAQTIDMRDVPGASSPTATTHTWCLAGQAGTVLVEAGGFPALWTVEP